MSRLTLCLLFMFLASPLNAQEDALASLGIALIPTPRECTLLSHKTYKQGKVKVNKQFVPTKGSDEYGISIRKGKVTIWGNELWASQTLQQLTTTDGKVPDVDIHDWPAYPWRGFMHDTGRNFQPLSLLKETIDLMARYKLNLFHWHLTDHPAWRIECHCYPQLNDPRYQRKGRDEGKFYTYDEIRSLITYARERGIMVMPEIDIPGHSAYFHNTFGFTMDSPQGKEVLARCLAEFFEEIPVSLCPYLHIGSDEIHIHNPQEFSTWIQELVHQSGRTPVAWEPGLPVLPYTIRQVWKGATSREELYKNNSKYVDSYVGYLSYFDPVMYAMRAFQHEAASQQTPDTLRALGGILCLWNDVRVDNKQNINLHNGMIPGMMAFAERFWHGGSNHPLTHENLYPNPSTPQGKALADMEARMLIHRNRYYTPRNIRWTPSAHIAWHVTLGNKEVEAWGGAVDLSALCKAHGIDAKTACKAEAQTVITVPADTVVKAWLGFEVPARSDRMATGIGMQGQWENHGQCFLNDKEILPPEPWQEPGAYNYPFHTWSKPQEEEAYTNEQFYWMRPPVELHLHKGANTIRIVTPHAFEDQRWSFAFMPLQ